MDGFTDFQVKKDELNTMLDEYAGALGEVL